MLHTRIIYYGHNCQPEAQVMNGVTQPVRPGWVSVLFVSCTYNWDCPVGYQSYLYPAPTPGTVLLGIRAICILHLQLGLLHHSNSERKYDWLISRRSYSPDTESQQRHGDVHWEHLHQSFNKYFHMLLIQSTNNLTF